MNKLIIAFSVPVVGAEIKADRLAQRKEDTLEDLRLKSENMVRADALVQAMRIKFIRSNLFADSLISCENNRESEEYGRLLASKIRNQTPRPKFESLPDLAFLIGLFSRLPNSDLRFFVMRKDSDIFRSFVDIWNHLPRLYGFKQEIDPSQASEKLGLLIDSDFNDHVWLRTY